MERSIAHSYIREVECISACCLGDGDEVLSILSRHDIRFNDRDYYVLAIEISTKPRLENDDRINSSRLYQLGRRGLLHMHRS